MTTENERDNRIRTRAYELWENDGRRDGDHERYWHEAARQIDAGGSFRSCLGPAARWDAARRRTRQGRREHRKRRAREGQGSAPRRRPAAGYGEEAIEKSRLRRIRGMRPGPKPVCPRRPCIGACCHVTQSDRVSALLRNGCPGRPCHHGRPCRGV
ncbi:DUF2934 domain-containing protein [Sinorhizobium meliloti]